MILEKINKAETPPTKTIDNIEVNNNSAFGTLTNGDALDLDVEVDDDDPVEVFDEVLLVPVEVVLPDLPVEVVVLPVEAAEYETVPEIVFAPFEPAALSADEQTEAVLTPVLKLAEPPNEQA
ncbi:hypothetical protein WICMUC_003097 [Wickerhamomyces mucosus]|uniref:Uncharacterized protein n=1 Tax=Wickerhamomyces mucosus TaxID=1378264 RepID=A0A9P8PMC4_9ASCO|nr:hypothetical protein WICMUC_003097 [Wickerhamomyces mucosus]